MARRKTLFFGIFCLTLHAGEKWQIDSDSSANISATNGWLSVSGSFETQVVKKNQPPQAGLTGEIDLDDTNGKITLNSISGNIWTQASSVPRLFKGVMDTPDLLDYTAHPRIHFSADKNKVTRDGKPQIEMQTDGTFLLHAELDVKKVKDIPVDFKLKVKKGKNGRLTASVVSQSSVEDHTVPTGKVDRTRLNLGGLPSMADPGVKVDLDVFLSRKTSRDPEPGDLPGRSYEYRHAAPGEDKSNRTTHEK